MENVAFIQITERKIELKIIQSRNGRYRVIEEVENRYDLTNDLMKDCLFSPKTKADILKIMGIYRFTIETYGTEKMIAFASNILVKARNYRGLLDEIYTNTGINIVLEGANEITKEMYDAIMTKIELPKALAVYVSGYNTYFFRYNRRSVVESVVVPYGYINLSTAKKSFAEKVELFRKEMKQTISLKNQEDDVVTMGVPIVDIARVAKKLMRYPIDIDNNYHLTKEGVDKVLDFTKDLDIDKTKKIKGLSEESVDSLSGGLAIVYAIYDAFKLDKSVVCDAELMDGKINQNLVGTSNERMSDLLINSLANYYEFKREGVLVNEHVYEMVTILFKQLKVVHKLSRNYVKPLKIAAYMFDCGKYIDFRNFEKHSYYVIMNTPLAGASQKEILIAALACECQNPDNFSLPEIMKYKDILSEDDIDAIRKIGVLVKLAATLNASRKCIITDIVCDILGDSIIMKTVTTSDPSFELMQSMKVAEDFRKIFRKSLQII